MKTFTFCVLSTLMMPVLAGKIFAQTNQAEKMMTWTSKSETAKDLALKGAHHYMNVEFEQAYNDFQQAEKLDPDFTVALVFLATLTSGQAKKDYEQRAIKSAANKTEGEKLFASILDEKSTKETRQETWSKLHTMFPDGAVIGHFYVISRATPGEIMAAGLEYIKKFPNQPAMYNNLAYGYIQEKKDTATAKQYFDKYLALYPEGANAYDSMGEYYMNTGDTANAEKYYKLALEKYPFMNSSVNAMQKINDQKKSTGTK